MNRKRTLGLAAGLVIWAGFAAPATESSLDWPQIQKAATNAASLFLNAAQRFEAVRTFVALVRIKGPSGQEQAVRDAVRRRLAQAKLSPVPGLEEDAKAPANLVMELPAAGPLASRPAILLNAHLDTISVSSPEFLAFDAAQGDFFHQHEETSPSNSSFGGDDRAAVAVIVEAVTFLQTHYWQKGVAHRRLLVVLTAEEERGCVGAKYLAGRRPQLFDAVEVALAMDGPLDFKSDYPQKSFVAVVSTTDAGAAPYQRVIELLSQLCRRKALEFGQTETGLGAGDFARFPQQVHAGLHLRSPVRGFHSRERVKVQDLINHIDLMCFLLLGWDGDPPEKSRPEAPGRSRVDGLR